MPPLTLLGPQRSHPTVASEIERLDIAGPVAVITAGWQEREAEDEELEEHLGRPVVDLRLYHRAERVFEQDQELFAGLRERQDDLRELQRLYRYRLDFALEPARELLASSNDSPFLEEQRQAAVAAVRRLDEQHLERIRSIHAIHDSTWQQGQRPAIRRQRQQLAELLEPCSALLIAGGHVAILVNRLRLFGLLELAARLPVIAWSAGAMALTERIVLFHDTPPQGAGNAEILDAGLGLLSDWLVMPHAAQRLRLHDQVRVALFAQRFSPARCIPLDDGDRLRFASRRAGSTPEADANSRVLTPQGTVATLGSSA